MRLFTVVKHAKMTIMISKNYARSAITETHRSILAMIFGFGAPASNGYAG